MKRVLFLGMMFMALASAGTLNAQTKIAYVSLDEVVQLMPEYKKAMSEMAQFDSALQIGAQKRIVCSGSSS